MNMFCPNCKSHMREYSFGRICKKCGFSKIKELQGIKLDNQDFELHTKCVLEKLKGVKIWTHGNLLPSLTQLLERVVLK